MTTSPSNQLACRDNIDDKQTTDLLVREAVNTVTGHIVNLDGPTAELGRAIRDTQELKQRLDAFRTELSIELLQRMDRAAKWTHEEDGVKVSSSSPNQMTYDPVQLASTLTTLVSSGAIDEEAAHGCIEMVPKVKKAGINAVLKLGGKIEEAVKACATPSTRPRAVKVEVR